MKIYYEIYLIVVIVLYHGVIDYDTVIIKMIGINI